MRLVIDSVGKQYRGNLWGLRDLRLELGPGVLGLLGPNGAGKSTLMRILATVTRPTEGRVLWNDGDIARSPDPLRQVLGYLPQDFGVYPHLTALEFLEYLAAVKGLDGAAARRRIDELLAVVNLSEARNRPLGGFSGGMKQRVGIAQALLNDPQLLIVDEPTAGLDPGERNRFYSLLSEIGEDVIVILSTHIVEDVMELCTNMAIIHQGKVLFAGAPSEAVKSLEGSIWQKSVAKAQVKDYEQRYRVISSKLIAGKPLLHIYSAENPRDGFTPVSADLEDVFFSRISGIEAHV